jgi:four helix bundle protein
MQGYEQLSVYKKSYKAALGIYKMSSNFSKEELYGITNQIKKAAVSIPLNIA